MVALIVEKPHVLTLAPERDPAVAAGEVLVRVQRAGICGSDMHIYHGANPFAVYPRVIGHEFSGIVEAVGAGVETVAVGDHVVVDPVVSCGRCYACRAGRTNVCGHLEVFGVHRDGGFRNRVAVPAANAIKVRDDLPFSIAALAEPLSIAANVLSRTGIGPDDIVLIYGAGTVGLTVVQVAKLYGARCVIADLDDARLARAKEFGADVILNSTRVSIPDAVRDENDGLGPTVVIDGAGVPALLEEACRLASPAGRIGLLGFSPAPCNISQQEIVKKELTLVGSRLNRRLLPQVIDWIESGRLKPEKLITQVFPAADAAEAFALIERDPGSTVKVQLDFSL